MSQELEDRQRWIYHVFELDSSTCNTVVKLSTELNHRAYEELYRLRKGNPRKHFGIIEVQEEE